MHHSLQTIWNYASRQLRKGSVGLIEPSLRPQVLADFIGQEQTRTNLAISITSARARRDALDHVLLLSPPGLGKTTLARIIARELQSTFHQTSAPMLTKPHDLVALMTNLRARDVLFIDEIHRLNPAIEEILYQSMEDYRLDPAPSRKKDRPAGIEFARFTLVGATTRAGMLSNALLNRFGNTFRLEFYCDAELERLVSRGASVLGVSMTPDGANEIARRARGTPRIAERLLRRVRDFMLVAGATVVDRALANIALTALNIDGAGLDAIEIRYLRTIATEHDGGPVGIETLAAALSEPSDSLEGTIEPFLLQKGFLQRTSRGRQLTLRAFYHLRLPIPNSFKLNGFVPETPRSCSVIDGTVTPAESLTPATQG